LVGERIDVVSHEPLGGSVVGVSELARLLGRARRQRAAAANAERAVLTLCRFLGARLGLGDRSN